MRIKVEVYPEDYLRLVRQRLELTQAEFAQQLGVKRCTVMKYESGINQIPTETLAAVIAMAGKMS